MAISPPRTPPIPSDPTRPSARDGEGIRPATPLEQAVDEYWAKIFHPTPNSPHKNQSDQSSRLTTSPRKITSISNQQISPIKEKKTRELTVKDPTAIPYLDKLLLEEAESFPHEASYNSRRSPLPAEPSTQLSSRRTNPKTAITDLTVYYPTDIEEQGLISGRDSVLTGPPGADSILPPCGTEDDMCKFAGNPGDFFTQQHKLYTQKKQMRSKGAHTPGSTPPMTPDKAERTPTRGSKTPSGTSPLASGTPIFTEANLARRVSCSTPDSKKQEKNSLDQTIGYYFKRPDGEGPGLIIDHHQGKHCPSPVFSHSTKGGSKFPRGTNPEQIGVMLQELLQYPELTHLKQRPILTSLWIPPTITIDVKRSKASPMLSQRIGLSAAYNPSLDSWEIHFFPSNN